MSSEEKSFEPQRDKRSPHARAPEVFTAGSPRAQARSVAGRFFTGVRLSLIGNLPGSVYDYFFFLLFVFADQFQQ
jgi:hypothetical protein